jgi:hypothetical protein
VAWAFLAMGLYPFLVMFPVVAATGEPSMLLIGLWGVPAAVIGIALTSIGPESAGDPGPTEGQGAARTRRTARPVVRPPHPPGAPERIDVDG